MKPMPMQITKPQAVSLPSDSNECWKVHGPKWEKWIGHLKGTPAQGLELGTFQGESAEAMLDHIFTHPQSSYTCVDTFQGSAEHHVGGFDCSQLLQQTTHRLERFGHRVHISESLSSAYLINVRRELDFIYVDAGHDSINVLRDSVLAWDQLVVVGVMVWDDYLWREFPDPLDCPRLAIDSFLTIYDRKLEVLQPPGWQIAVRKLSEA